jgi:hypothetical protein
MSLIDNAPEPEVVSINAPPLPGEGDVVYFMTHGPVTIVARLAKGDILASIWSWDVGEQEWVRNYAC